MTNAAHNKKSDILKTKIHNIFAYIFVLILLLTVINNTFFLHVHHMPDGRIIVHSHPIQSSENTNNALHHHTKAELLFIKILNQFVFTLLFLLLLIISQTTFFTPVYYLLLFFIHKYPNAERAPPVLI